MCVIERKQFAELTKSPTLKGYYLETRNAILSRWHLDHLRFLTPFEALKHIPRIVIYFSFLSPSNPTFLPF